MVAWDKDAGDPKITSDINHDETSNLARKKDDLSEKQNEKSHLKIDQDQILNQEMISNADTDALDFDTLYHTLDGLVADEQMDRQMFEGYISPFVAQRIQISHDKNFIKHMQILSRSDYWGTVGDDLTTRPKYCLDCVAIQCQHIEQADRQNPVDQILDELDRVCEHTNIDDTKFEDICVKCLVEGCENMDMETQNSVVYVWDTQDLADYRYWINKMAFSYGLDN